MAKRRVGGRVLAINAGARPGAVSPDRALCIPTFSHFVIVNKTPLSLSLSLSLSPLSLAHSRSWASEGDVPPAGQPASACVCVCVCVCMIKMKLATLKAILTINIIII
jgi:hypothetical protein